MAKLCPFKIMKETHEFNTSSINVICSEKSVSFGYCEEEKCAMWIKEDITNYNSCPTADKEYISYCGLANHRTR